MFRDSGYQAFGVGKLHVSPQRNRIGFDDVMLEEQGRHQFHEIPDGVADDYELFLSDSGFQGEEYASGMTQNEWISRAWHLPERVHPINWAAREMCKFIRRRDPGRPSFWYLSFSAPHPPLTPIQAYLDLYRDVQLPEPAIGDWADPGGLPYSLAAINNSDTGALVRGREFEVDQASQAPTIAPSKVNADYAFPNSSHLRSERSSLSKPPRDRVLGKPKYRSCRGCVRCSLAIGRSS